VGSVILGGPLGPDQAGGRERLAAAGFSRFLAT